jgi:hypothetical protein
MGIRRVWEELVARSRAVWRDQGLGLLVTAITLVSLLWIYRRLRYEGQPAHADGHYIWLWARSAVFDHDWIFANDYQLCGDPFKIAEQAHSGPAPNPYYVGPSLLWIPVLFVLRAVEHLPADSSREVLGACTGPLVSQTLYLGPIVGALVTFLSYRMARRIASDGPAALAAALLCLGGQLPPFAASVPAASHVYAAFSLALVGLTTLRASERPEAIGRWIACAAAIAYCVLQRPPGLVYGLVPATVAVALRMGRRRTLLVLAVLAAGAAAGTIPLLFIYKAMYGGYFTSPVSGDYLHLLEPHPFLLLFAPHGGLFYSTPIVWLSVVGLPFALRDRATRAWLWPFVVAASIEGYVYASGLDWHASGTVGARRLTTLTPLYVVLATYAIVRIVEWLRARPQRVWGALGVATAVPVLVSNLGITIGYAKNEINCCHGSSQAELYGQGSKAFWEQVDERVGDVAVLPAAMWLAFQHGIPVRRFRDATESRYYQRDFRTRKFGRNDLPFGDAELVTVGFEDAKPGQRMTGTVGRVVFAAEWPRATSMTFSVRSTQPAELAVGRRGALGFTRAWGTLRLPGGPDWVERTITLPPGGFSSGIMDLVLRQAQPATTDVWIKSVRIDDSAP